MIQYLIMDLSLITSPGLAHCANTFWNKTFSTYCYQSIGDYGLYIFSIHVFLWAYVCSWVVINRDCVSIRVKYRNFWGLNYREEYVSYPVLWNYTVDKGYVIGVSFVSIFISFWLGLLYFGFPLLLMLFFYKPKYWQP